MSFDEEAVRCPLKNPCPVFTLVSQETALSADVSTRALRKSSQQNPSNFVPDGIIMQELRFLTGLVQSHRVRTVNR